MDFKATFTWIDEDNENNGEDIVRTGHIVCGLGEDYVLMLVGQEFYRVHWANLEKGKKRYS